MLPEMVDERVATKRILFVHQNFPGQFPHITAAARAKGYKLAAIAGPSAKGVPGVDLRRWKLTRGSTAGLFDPATRAEADLLRGCAAAEVAATLKADGFIPDLIVGHPGWGEMLMLGEVFRGVPQVAFGEFYYQTRGGDVNFDKEFEQETLESDMRVYAKNMGLALSYAAAHTIVCPTPFQASTFPDALRSRILTLHEGIDVGRAFKKPSARLKLSSGKVLDGSKPTITFINRNFERLRGFHIFMRALPAFLEQIPDADILIIGTDAEKGYGGALPNGQTWKQKMLAEVGDKLDISRIHFTGALPHADMVSAMSISWAHVYYTYPFVLSWSLVEAMACECLVLASNTAPVRDAITSGVEGVLNDFFDVEALSEAMIEACNQPEKFATMRRRAREKAMALFDRETVGVPGWMALIEDMIGTP